MPRAKAQPASRHDIAQRSSICACARSLPKVLLVPIGGAVLFWAVFACLGLLLSDSVSAKKEQSYVGPARRLASLATAQWCSAACRALGPGEQATGLRSMRNGGGSAGFL